MTYVRIILYLHSGEKKSGIRRFEPKWNLAEIKTQAWQQAIETLGRGAIEDVLVQEVPADDPEVVKFILKDTGRK